MATPTPERTDPTPQATRDVAQLVGALIVLAGALGFSTKAILIKLAYQAQPGIDAITILAARMAFSLPVFLAVALWGLRRGAPGPKVGARDVPALALLGVLGYYGASLLDTAGLEYLSASTERVVLFVYPTLVVLIGAAFLRERVRPAVLGALVATYAGVALAVGAVGAQAGPGLARGAALVFGAALAFAVFMVTGVPVLRRLGAVRFTAWTMAAAGLATGAHYAAAHGAGTGAAMLNGRVLALCLAMALVATVLPAFLMAEGMRRIGAGRAAVIGTVGPVATIAMDHLVLGEAVTGPQAMGTALVLAGVLAVSLDRNDRSGGRERVPVSCPSAPRTAAAPGPAPGS